MDALAQYDDEGHHGPPGPPEGPGPAPENPGGPHAVPYKKKWFLSAISSFKTPDPLNDENWVAWKGQITPMLELNGVWTHCDGVEVAPPPEEVERYKEWEIAECVACILILNNLSAVQFVHVSQATSVKQMWDSLKAIHEHRGQQSIMAIRHTLYQAHAKDGDDIIAHLTNMHSLQAQLHHMGLMVPDQDFTNILVSSLPESWDLFTTSYQGSQMGDNVLMSQQLVAIIRDKYNRRTASKGGTGGTETVLAAHSSSKHVTGKRKAAEGEKTKKVCFTCGRTNHLAKDCFFKGKTKCGNCGRFNHETSECRSTGKGKEKETTITESVTTQNGKRRKVERAQQAHNVHEDEEMEDGMYVTQNIESSDCADIDANSWLADSVASSHLSNLRDAFIEFTPLNKTIWGVGSVEVPVEGRGTVNLKKSDWTTICDCTKRCTICASGTKQFVLPFSSGRQRRTCDCRGWTHPPIR